MPLRDQGVIEEDPARARARSSSRRILGARPRSRSGRATACPQDGARPPRGARACSRRTRAATTPTTWRSSRRSRASAPAATTSGSASPSTTRCATARAGAARGGGGRGALDRLGGEVDADRAVEIIETGAEPLRELIGALHTQAAGRRAQAAARRARVIRRGAAGATCPASREAMGAAFEDDPIASWFWNKPKGRREYIAGLVRARRQGALHRARRGVRGRGGRRDTRAARCGRRPATWRFAARRGAHDPLRAAAARPARADGERRDEADRARVTRARRTGTCSELGVRPQSQGRGLGSQLMFEMLARSDRERTPAYLESSTERSRALYERHGFRTTRGDPDAARRAAAVADVGVLGGSPTSHADGGDDGAAERHLNQRLRAGRPGGSACGSARSPSARW